MDSSVWLIVCLAAVEAMDCGRRCLYRLHQARGAPLPPRHSGGLPRSQPPRLAQSSLLRLWHLPDAVAPPLPTPSRTAFSPSDPIVGASAAAVAAFWEALSDFAALGGLPGLGALPATHPFLAGVTDGSTCVRLNR